MDFRFITFSGDKPENIPNILKLSTASLKLELISTKQGIIKGIPFIITNDGYLEFNVD